MPRKLYMVQALSALQALDLHQTSYIRVFPKMGMTKAYHITGEKAIPRSSYFRPLLLAIIRRIIFAVPFFAFLCSIPACICEV
jgi:hypothetical protein